MGREFLEQLVESKKLISDPTVAGKRKAVSDLNIDFKVGPEPSPDPGPDPSPHPERLELRPHLPSSPYISLNLPISPSHLARQVTAMSGSKDMRLDYNGIDPTAAALGEGEPADLKKLTEFLEDDYNGNRVVIDCTASQEVRLLLAPAAAPHPTPAPAPNPTPAPAPAPHPGQVANCYPYP